MIVCAIDKLKEIKIDKNCDYGIVVNLSHSSESGSHWTALYISRGSRYPDGVRVPFIHYFDSFGFLPKSYYIRDFIDRHTNSSSYNHRQLQQLTSKVCGMYAACFILHMSRGGQLESFVAKFSKNLYLNDLFIHKNYKYYLRNSEVRNLLTLRKRNLASKRRKFLKRVTIKLKKK